MIGGIAGCHAGGEALPKGGGELGAERFAVQHLGLHFQAAVGLWFYLGEADGELGDFLGGDDGGVLHVLCLPELQAVLRLVLCGGAVQVDLQEFLHHLHDADAGRDGMPGEVGLIDGPFGVELHVEGWLPCLVRQDGEKVVL